MSTTILSLETTYNSQLGYHPYDSSGLMDELESFRKRNEHLHLLNSLYSRLAAAPDLASIIESFSVWLMPQVPHDLVGYHNFECDRTYISCSCHGPERTKVVNIAENLFENSGQVEKDFWHEENYYIHNWYLGSLDLSGLVLIFSNYRAISNEERELINEALSVLKGSVDRALEFEYFSEAAKKDSLTGLANRRVFDERVEVLMETAKRYGQPLTLMSLDLDNFKSINDTYGHAEGDKALGKVSKAIADLVRSSDLLVRQGGDEFMLLLPNTDAEAARVLAERLCRVVSELGIKVDSYRKLGVSIGLAQLQTAMSKKDWLSFTDEKLYQAKKRGRCQVCS